MHDTLSSCHPLDVARTESKVSIYTLKTEGKGIKASEGIQDEVGREKGEGGRFENAWGNDSLAAVAQKVFVLYRALNDIGDGGLASVRMVWKSSTLLESGIVEPEISFGAKQANAMRHLDV